MITFTYRKWCQTLWQYSGPLDIQESPKGQVLFWPVATTSTTPITPDIHPSLPSSSQGAAIIDSATVPASSGFWAIVQQEVTAVTINDLDND